MEPIKRFFECLIPVTVCNLKCSYCYVIQRNRRNMRLAEMKYAPERMGAALTKERLGGTCFFSVCGAGETTLQPELPEIIFRIMEQGHYVNVTTNGATETQIGRILARNAPHVGRLHFSFSFHYLELERRGLLERFFQNVRKVKEAGASFIIQLNLCDEYLPYLETVRRLCVENTGAMPQVAATRKKSPGLRKIELLTDMSADEYMDAGKSFASPLFQFTMENFNVRRREFCYAGDWSGNLDLSTGILRRCYCSCLRQDIFKNPDEPIRFLAVGYACGSPFCMNASHFLSLGVIPELATPTYAQLRERAGWYTDEMKCALSGKLKDANQPYSAFQKLESNIVGIADSVAQRAARAAHSVMRRS